MDVCNGEPHYFQNVSSDRLEIPRQALLNKRKSSPAILDFPFNEAQMNLYLSRQRNSIEAAMLLVNFNQSITLPIATENKGQWQDDMSIPTNKPTEENNEKRRYSYDTKMTWETMPESFQDRTDLITSSTSSSSSSSTTTNEDVKIIWTHDPTPPYIDTKGYPPTLLYPPPRFPPPPQDSMLHPLASQSDVTTFHGGMKRDYPTPYYTTSYTFPPPPPPPPMYYHHHPMSNRIQIPPSPLALQRTHLYKKQKVEDESEEEVVPETEYPDMSEKDLEAAKVNPEARPRKQKLRFAGDQYTPSWVRYNGQQKEGLCDTCKPGKWLQLKNSAFWYHKQFYHGISSVSGKEFVEPLEKRWVAQDLIEGLCHQCNTWIAVSNVKRKNSVLWYRHAHKCHLYNKPAKHGVSRKR